MFGRQIDPVNHRCLATLDVKTVEAVQQRILAGGEILDGFDLIAADKAFQKSFVAFLVAVDNRLGGVEYLVELRPQRAGSIDR